MFARIVSVLCVLAAVTAAVLTAPPPATATEGGYVLSQVSYPDGTAEVLRWNGCQDITYKVNLNAVPADRHEQIRWEIRVALAELSRATGLRFADRGATGEIPQVGSGAQQSAELVIAYTTPWQTNHDLTGSQIGKGGYEYRTWWQGDAGGRAHWDSAITRGFVVIDTADVLSRLRPGFGYGRTRGNLLLHELGHVVGLQHVADGSQMMAPMLTDGTPNGYSGGDWTALQRVGTGYGCIDVPAWVTPDLT